MGSIPVANPSPPRRWRFSRRVVPLAFLAAASVAAVAVALALVWPSPDGDLVNVGQARSLETEVPVRHGNFYVVKQESGEILALSQRDPHRGCRIPFRPDFEFMGRTGWFRDPCGGSTYDLAGTLVSGPSPRNMDRYEVNVRGGGSVVVDTSRRLCAPDYTATSCP